MTFRCTVKRKFLSPPRPTTSHQQRVNMKSTKKLICAIFFLAIFIVPSLLSAASDCSGPWQSIQNIGNQAPCRALGLDSNRGVCRPGDIYEIFCDDKKGGRYRTCTGPRPCGAQAAPPINNNNNCVNWDYNYNQPCPPGFVNRDCRGGCER